MLYVIARTVEHALDLAAEVGEPRKTTVPITPRNYWTACRGRGLMLHDTVLFAQGTRPDDGMLYMLDLMGVTLTPDEQVRLRVSELELR